MESKTFKTFCGFRCNKYTATITHSRNTTEITKEKQKERKITSMKKLKKILTSATLALSIAVLQPSLLTAPVSASASSSENPVKLEMYNYDKDKEASSIITCFRITNTSDSAIDLSKLALRYYYTSDGCTTKAFSCYSANIYSAGTLKENISSMAKGRTGNVSSPTVTANKYLEFYFNGNKTLGSGEYIELIGEATKSGTKKFNQINDYSFNRLADDYTETNKITAHLDKKLIGGTVPSNSTQDLLLSYEAEDGIVSRSGMIKNSPYCSSGKYVGDITENDTLKMNVYVTQTGNYNMTVYYRSAQSATLECNGTEFSCAGNVNENIVGSVSNEITLFNGCNTLEFSSPDGCAPEVDSITITKNLDLKGSFEYGYMSSPSRWTPSDPDVCSWLTENNSKILSISGNQKSLPYFQSDSIQLEPYKYYTAEVSARAVLKEGKSIITEDMHFKGANISVLYRDPEHSDFIQPWIMNSKGKQLTNGWETVTMNFQAPADGIVKFKLNNWHSDTVCSFDNFKIYPDDTMVKLEGQKASFGYPRSAVVESGITSYGINSYIAQYDELISRMESITGNDYSTHFHGEKLRILNRREFAWGGEAGSKYIIGIDTNAVKNDLKGYADYFVPRTNGTNVFSLINWPLSHEIGHVFDSEEWNFDCEFFASFKVYLALTKGTDMPVFINNTVYGYPNCGRVLSEYFSRPELLAVFETTKFEGDYLIYRLGVKDGGVSLNSITNTFKYFTNPANAYEINQMSNPEKFERFVTKLEEFEGNNISLFTSEELSRIKNHY